MIPALTAIAIDLFIRQQELRSMSRSLRRSVGLFRGYASPGAGEVRPKPALGSLYPHDEPGAGTGRERVEYDAPAPQEEFTEAQKLALLIARGCDFARACAGAMIAAGIAVDRADFSKLVALNLAIDKGSFHVLTPFGRWKALQVAREAAARYGINVRTYVARRSGSYEPSIKAKFNHW